MKIHKTQFANCIKAIIITSLSMASNVQAQNVANANVVSNSINTPCGGPLSPNITSLNVDMVEIDASTSNARCAWGTGSDTYIWAAVYSGLNQGTPCNSNTAGVTIGHSSLGQTTGPLPPYWAQVPGPINYIDVAVGIYSDGSWQSYFIMTAYESGGNIYLEHYNILLNPIFGLVGPPMPACPPVCGPTYVPYQLSNTNEASRPHIDLIYNNTYPGNGVTHEAVGYVVTWQEKNGLTAEVWGC